MSSPKLILLPIDEILPDLIAALADHPAAVLRAATGAGKTTRVPPALLRARPDVAGRVLVLQPRRIAARTTAARMADENGWRLGEQVGYHVRFDRRTGPATRIEVVTEGILLQRLLHDPFLDSVQTVVFDEFHERNVNSELALGMVRQVQQAVRPDLQVVVMSATLDPQPVARFLGDCPVLECDVPRYPVQVSYSNPDPRQPIAVSTDAGVREMLEHTSGDILAFLPGLREIRQTRQLLATSAEQRNLRILPLYGDLPTKEQDAVFERCDQRRVILATNVAETSLTLEGITAVVDSGWVRQSQFDSRVGLDRLRLVPISQASADQRTGRAGRTGPGTCLRLWDERTHRTRPLRDEAEIRRVDLAAAVLCLLGWIEPDLDTFPWFEKPRAESLHHARELLRQLDAVNDGGITDLGRRLARLPLHPRLGRLLLEGTRHGCAAQAALAAAILSERSPFARSESDRGRTPRNGPHSDSDLWDRVAALERFEHSRQLASQLGQLQAGPARWLLRTRDQLLRQVQRPSRRRHSPPSATKHADGPQDARTTFQRILLAAFPDRLAKRREPGSRRGLMVGGRGVRLSDDSRVVDGELFLCLEVDRGRTEALVRCASIVHRPWLPAHQLRRETVVFFDATSERVCARQRIFWQDLLLDQSPTGIDDPARAAAVLAEAARQHWPHVFSALPSAVRSLVTRVRCLRDWMPELDLPPLDDAQLQELLPPLCQGCKGFDDLQRAAWLTAIQQALGYEHLPTVEREAPQHLVVPSGRSLPLHYEEGKAPVLAARIQELFGLAETPRVARGRVPVLLHLLAPNMRPQQVTDDLPSFWKNTYPEVRKQLRGRYPKHAWPESPSPGNSEPLC